MRFDNKTKAIIGPSWMLELSSEMAAQLSRGAPVLIGSKVYRACGKCWSIVRINKPIIGSLHLCDLDETERAEQAQ